MTNPADTDPDAPATILETSDSALLGIAKSLLEDAGIEHFVNGEGLQDLFAFGRLGTGFNPIVGPARIQVAAEDAARARELLKDLAEP
jgi:Putative prokaryotic signal transducing protein